MAVVNVVQLHLGQRMGKGELLKDAVIFVNVLGPFLQYIQLTTIYLVGDHVAYVLQLVHPGQGVPTEIYAWQFPWSLEEGHAFRFALSWILVS